MAAAAVAASLSQQAVVDAFMRSDAVRPSEAIFFQPKGSIQRSFFTSYTKAGIIKPEGARWFLDVPAYNAAKRKHRRTVAAVAGLLAAAAAVAALL